MSDLSKRSFYGAMGDRLRGLRGVRGRRAGWVEVTFVLGFVLFYRFVLLVLRELVKF